MKRIATIGMFDGVHEGHKQILRRLRREAEERGMEAVVVTFDRHPREVTHEGGAALRLLNSHEERMGLIDAYSKGARREVIAFTRDKAEMTACEFFERYLCEELEIGALLMGHDNSFGSKARDDSGRLPEVAAERGVVLLREEALQIGGDTVSSTLIRRNIESGEVERAKQLLGYAYGIGGQVSEGRKVGRSLGFPTANIVLDDPQKLLPREGVYAVRAEIDGVIHNGIANLGGQPTFGQGQRVLEVHLTDFGGDLYGKEMRTTFHYRMRDTKRFENVEALKEQIKKDEQEAQRLLLHEEDEK